MSSGASVASTGSSQISMSSTKLPSVNNGAWMKKMLGVESIDDKKDDKAPLLFRGFIGGDMFKTSKGYQGSRVDTLWVRQVFDSFPKDDTEIIDFAMKSSLADPATQVIGGHYGSVFSIGDFGFNTLSQFEVQQKVLAENERKVSKGIEYLTQMEWETVDDNLMKLASHGKAKITSAIRGDTLAALAVREGAFHVAKKLIEYGVDPLLINEEGEDVFLLLKTQYKILTQKLSQVNEDKEKASHHVVLPSEMVEINAREEEVLHKLDAQVQFVDIFRGVLVDRIKEIESDKIVAQRLRIRHKPIPPQLAWSVEQGERAQDHVDESDEFKQFILDRIAGQKKYNETHVNLADLVHKQSTRMIKGPGDDDDDDESSMDTEHQRKLEATIHQKRGVREARARLANIAPSSTGSSTSFELVSDHSEDGDPLPASSLVSLDSSQPMESPSTSLIEPSGSLSQARSGRSRFKKVKKIKSATHGMPDIQGTLSEKRHADGHVEEMLLFR